MPHPTQFYLPDLLAVCPFEDATSPHYRRAAAESSTWVNNYNLFNDRKRAFFNQGLSELLVSHAYCYADYDQFRTCCDFVNLLFVVDEISDEQNGKDAGETGMVYLNAMQDAEWDDGSVLAKMTKEFRARLLKYAGPGCFKRFLKHSADYVRAVGKEAEYRERGEVLDLNAYETLRRENSAVRVCFGLFEFVLGVDLPDEVFECPEFMTLYWAACDMICWSNDVYSYNMEQAKGHSGNNIVTVLMRAKGVDLQTASDLVGEHFTKLMIRFIHGKSQLPSWGKATDSAVAAYVRAMEHWVKGNLTWSFESQRYFGPRHEEIRETRLIQLHPTDDAHHEDKNLDV
ncbi:isoprenoid synthase domain-containing protein [Cristinia sonorae]|uniref:Terpene synthase n=1 Tax=Cristinia sonorae TaxID=1940300 RepID=A0A8K0UP02_9AGAR|nr:isoprenoid synthase domain-containing protein [Cristinia sonorae]